MIRYVYLIIVVFGCPVCLQAQENVAQASQWMQEQEYLKAFTVFEQCYSKDSSRLDCAQGAGTAAMKLGNLAVAKKYFHILEDNFIYYKNANIQLAAIYEMQENVPKAIKYNRRLRDSFPDNFLYHRQLGKLSLKAELPIEALAHYTDALRLNPDDLVTIKAYADMMINMSQPATADSLLRRGLEIDSTYIALSLLQAKNFYKQKAYDSTVMVLSKLRSRIDFTNYYHKMMGYSLIQIDSVEQSIYHLQESLINESDPEYSLYYLGTAYDKLGEPESALHYYRLAIEHSISPGTSTYYKLVARLEKEQNNMREAIKAYEWSYRLKEDPVLLIYLAMASEEYYKDKNIAIRYYQQYLRKKDDNQEYRNYAKEKIRYLKEIQHLKAVK